MSKRYKVRLSIELTAYANVEVEADDKQQA
jgi:hypothetical protein